MLGKICDGNWRTPSIHRSGGFQGVDDNEKTNGQKMVVGDDQGSRGHSGTTNAGLEPAQARGVRQESPGGAVRETHLRTNARGRSGTPAGKGASRRHRCPWPVREVPRCRAYKGGKYRAKHTNECRKRFESLLAESVRGRRRFEAARERQLDGISRKAMEMEGAIETEAPAVASGSAASGSGQTPAEKQRDVARQNAEELQKGLAASKGEILTGKPAAARPRTSFNRKAPDTDIDDSRLDPARSQG